MTGTSEIEAAEPHQLSQAVASVTTRMLERRTPTTGSFRPDDRTSYWRRAVGPRYVKCRLSTFEFYGTESEQAQQRRVLDALKTFSADIKLNVQLGRNIVMFGPPGTGKDHLAIGVLHAVMTVANPEACAHEICITTGAELFSSVRDSFQSEERTEAGELRHWSNPKVLLISDPQPPFEQVRLTDFQASFLLRVVDARYRECRPTFVTMNVANGKEAGNRLGPQVVDRLRDGGLTCFCNWPSYRKPSEEV